MTPNSETAKIRTGWITVCLLWVAVFVGIALMSGCVSWGQRVGYSKAKEFYSPGPGSVRMPAFAWGFHKGWERYILEQGRK